MAVCQCKRNEKKNTNRKYNENKVVPFEARISVSLFVRSFVLSELTMLLLHSF